MGAYYSIYPTEDDCMPARILIDFLCRPMSSSRSSAVLLLAAALGAVHVELENFAHGPIVSATNSRNSIPVVFKLPQPLLRIIYNQTDINALRLTGDESDVGLIDEIGDYELLPYVPPVVIALPGYSDDIDEDVSPGGFVAYAHDTEFERLRPILESLRTYEISWNTLFVHTADTTFPIKPDRHAIIFLDSARLHVKPGLAAEPESISLFLLGVALVRVVKYRVSRIRV